MLRFVQKLNKKKYFLAQIFTKKYLEKFDKAHSQKSLYFCEMSAYMSFQFTIRYEISDIGNHNKNQKKAIRL